MRLKFCVFTVTFAATAIYSYWWLIPLSIYGFLWWRSSTFVLTFSECLCIYGYSLAVYIPTSLLWVVPIVWLQWVFVGVAALLSGAVLALVFWPAVQRDERRYAVLLILFILLMHTALATGFMVSKRIKILLRNLTFFLCSSTFFMFLLQSRLLLRFDRILLEIRTVVL